MLRRGPQGETARWDERKELDSGMKQYIYDKGRWFGREVWLNGQHHLVENGGEKNLKLKKSHVVMFRS